MRISDWSKDVCSSDLDLGIIRIGGGQRLELGESARIILALKAERREVPHQRLFHILGRAAAFKHGPRRLFQKRVVLLGRRDIVGELADNEFLVGGLRLGRRLIDLRKSGVEVRSEENKSELQSLMRNSSDFFCLN